MKSIVVLGFHRSGTSLVSGILHNLGVKLWSKPEQEMKSTDHNKLGYYENWDFVHLNDFLLKEASGSWKIPPGNIYLKKVGEKYKTTIIKIINNNVINPLWGWKDPRSCLTFQLFLPYLINPHIVIVNREYESIYNSFKKTRIDNGEIGFRPEDPEEYFDFLYKRYMINVNDVATNHPRIILNYENILENPDNNIKQLGRFLDVEINKDKNDDILKLIKPELRRF